MRYTVRERWKSKPLVTGCYGESLPRIGDHLQLFVGDGQKKFEVKEVCHFYDDNGCENNIEVIVDIAAV